VYANNAPSFYEAYASRVAELKGLEPSGELTDRLSAAFNSVYRLVALDIDGTLTVDTKPDIDPAAAVLVAALLRQGVEVLLVTGRGRDATRRAAKELSERGDISGNLLSRLSALTNNGVVLLESAPGGDMLQRETSLHPGFGLDEAREAVDLALGELDIRHDTRPHALTSDGEGTRGALRIELRSDDDQVRALEALTNEELSGIKLTTGRYGATPTIDLTSVDKAEAIARVADRRGIDPDMILRIGDRGADPENDWTMLNSAAGFTVGSFSMSDEGCWPVLRDDGEQLFGTDATRALIDGVLLFPPLSIAPEDPTGVLNDLLRVQEISEGRARQELRTFEQRMTVRATLSAGTVRTVARARTLHAADFFDPRSGGVRLRDWELESVADAATELFELPSIQLPPPEEEPAQSWSMWTDTGVLLRGPEYYRGVIDHDATFESVAAPHAEFLSRGSDLIQQMTSRGFSLVDWKIALGLLDYARNATLHALVAAFGADDQPRGAAAHLALVDVSDVFAALLVDSDAAWDTIRPRLAEQLNSVCSLLRDASAEMGAHTIYGYRECDSFVENFMAAEIALRDLRESGAWDPSQPVLAVGLAYGGAELPAALTSVARRQGSTVLGSLLRLSTYGEARLDQTSKVRRGDADYVRELKEEPGRFMVLESQAKIDPKVPVILCDDNLTTAISLQHARDVLLLLDYRVIGAAVVRYPSANRAVHMNLDGHGFPDPTALSSYIRGLVAPSPYTRLVVPGDEQTGVYRNRRGRFNKAKERIEALLGIDGGGSQ
jgi:hydroxymethylpyrimidine pyrophosphatase-like HAD family hydrolase